MKLLKFLSAHRFSRYQQSVFLLFDLFLLNLTYLLSIYFRNGNLERINDEDVKTIWLFANFLWFLIATYYSAYQFVRTERLETILGKLTKYWAIHTAAISLLLFILKFSGVSRIRVFTFYVLFFAFLFVFRIIGIKLLKAIRSKGYNFRKVVIVGFNKTSIKLMDSLTKDLSYGYRINGFFDNQAPLLGQETILGSLADLPNYLETEKIDEMYISMKGLKASELENLVQLCDRHLIRVKFIPEFHGIGKLRQIEIEFLGNIPLLKMRREPLSFEYNRLRKSLFDKFFSLFVILTIFPWLFPILIVLIKLGSKGPIFFKQERTGENNESFVCFKFRTMRVNQLSDELQATKNDPRITKLGAFMRKTNLDELPQFFNVLYGSMSVVGPRPHMLKHTLQYSAKINDYLVRHYAKPGITGWAQVKGYRGETKELSQMQKRVEYDIWYIENWSFILDIKIIWMTVRNMFKGEKNAF